MSGVQESPEQVSEPVGEPQAPGLARRWDDLDAPRLGCKTPLSAGRAIARWQPTSIAKAIEDGIITHWPHEFTRLGWRWLRRRGGAEERAG